MARSWSASPDILRRWPDWGGCTPRPRTGQRWWRCTTPSSPRWGAPGPGPSFTFARGRSSTPGCSAPRRLWPASARRSSSCPATCRHARRWSACCDGRSAGPNSSPCTRRSCSPSPSPPMRWPPWGGSPGKPRSTSETSTPPPRRCAAHWICSPTTFPPWSTSSGWRSAGERGTRWFPSSRSRPTSPPNRRRSSPSASGRPRSSRNGWGTCPPPVEFSRCSSPPTRPTSRPSRPWGAATPGKRAGRSWGRCTAGKRSWETRPRRAGLGPWPIWRRTSASTSTLRARPGRRCSRGTPGTAPPSGHWRGCSAPLGTGPPWSRPCAAVPRPTPIPGPGPMRCSPWPRSAGPARGCDRRTATLEAVLRSASDHLPRCASWSAQPR